MSGDLASDNFYDMLYVPNTQPEEASDDLSQDDGAAADGMQALLGTTGSEPRQRLGKARHKKVRQEGASTADNQGAGFLNVLCENVIHCWRNMGGVLHALLCDQGVSCLRQGSRPRSVPSVALRGKLLSQANRAQLTTHAALVVLLQQGTQVGGLACMTCVPD
ncbi:TPA: hypothetical protein ACH3X2_009614 [Trebouxia sp. C0005]